MTRPTSAPDPRGEAFSAYATAVVLFLGTLVVVAGANRVAAVVVVAIAVPAIVLTVGIGSTATRGGRIR